MTTAGGKKPSRREAVGGSAGGLRAHRWKRFLRGPDPELLETLYVTALAEAVRYNRCCAYFSSSVLAAAARGFGRLIERLVTMGQEAPRPAVRLVVNEELAAEDVRAMTEAGDLSGLERALTKRFKKPKDLLQRRRLQMLGWLVKEGLLEVRVGVMRRSEGILHGKFGVITDPSDDAVVFSGSGNESARGLLANYERLEVSTSWGDPDRHREYAEEFQALWEDRHADVHTVTLPDALRLKLIKFAPKEPPVQEPREVLKRQQAAMLWRFIVEAPYLAGPEGAAACDATAMVDLWPHQRRVVEETAAAWPDGRLLCDEVGLGKTIEAVFVLRRLMAGRGVRRALLLVPKNLVNQWQGELREKGGLIVPRLEGLQTLVWPDETKEKAKDLAEALRQDVLVMSRETARLESNLAVLLEAEPWDLVLLDEAHAARRRRQEEGEFNSATLLLALLRQLQLRRKARGVLLLSATPMQTHPWEPWDLLAVLGEGGAWLAEFGPVRQYYRAIAAVEDGRCDLETAERAAALVAADTAFPKPPGDGTWAGDAKAVSERLAFATTVERGNLADWLRQGSPLARRMHRSSRRTLRAYHEMGLLPEPPPGRHVEDIVFDFEDPAERRVYESITGYIDRRFEVLEREKPGKGFVMTVYRRRAASSPLALKRSLERRRSGLERVANQYAYSAALEDEDVPERLDEEDLPEAEATGVSAAYPEDRQAAREELAEVDKVLEKLADLGERDSKQERFFEILRAVTDDGRPALVFSEYWDTLDYLREALVSCYGTGLGCYSGAGGQVWDGQEWRTVGKDGITRALRDGELQVLICTDAASEGLNLQAAGALINYDLPWNPSRVEQRIGRIDRIGQKHPTVRVVNLYLKNSVDDKVYGALHRRCGLFEHFIGPMQPVLARARRMLTGQDAFNPTDLEAMAHEVEADPLPRETYLEAAAEQPSPARPGVTLHDLEEALTAADGELGLRVRRKKGSQLWAVSGLGQRSVFLAPTLEHLERYAEARPLSPFDEYVRLLADRLGQGGERLPLVVESRQEGPFRASVAYWVTNEGHEAQRSLADLRHRCDTWDGEYCPPELWQRAVRAAREEAGKRVRNMVKQAAEREEAGIGRQTDAARHRLLWELGRYLMCLGGGADGLNERLYEQMSRDIASARRLQRCLERLGGDYPEWPLAMCRELERFAEGLAENQRQARLLGRELDAALDDPRWAAAVGAARTVRQVAK